MDGRLLHTVPDLFLHPGRLARDYMENRIARHVPPFRTFLVALLLFIFAAEHAAQELQALNARQSARHQAELSTAAGRAREAASMRGEAAKDLAGDLAEAARDRADDLGDAGLDRASAQAAYAREQAKIEARHAAALAKADRISRGLDAEPAPAKNENAGHGFRAGIKKAIANPDYYLSVLFTWAHRAAILLLPIVGCALALVYRKRRDVFFYDHLLVAMNLLSFAFLTNAFGLILPRPVAFWWLGLVALWMPVNLFQTLRGAYGSTILAAALKTLFVWVTTVIAFGFLVTGLIVFALSQL